MNSLDLTKTGGESFAQDDLLWMQLAIQAAITGAATINGVKTYIIAGCNIENILGNTSATGGVMLFNGEVCVFDGVGSITLGSNQLYWQIATTYDPTGLIPFFSGGPNEMYKVNKVILVAAASAPAGAILASTVPTQGALMQQAINAADTGWVNVPQANFSFAIGNCNLGSTICRIKIAGKTVSYSIAIQATSLGAGLVAISAQPNAGLLLGLQLAMGQRNSMSANNGSGGTCTGFIQLVMGSGQLSFVFESTAVAVGDCSVSAAGVFEIL